MRFPIDADIVERRLREIDARYRDEHSDAVLGMLRRAVERVDGGAGAVVYRFVPQPWMANPAGVVHGGVLATMLDNAMGMTAAACCGGMTPTVELQLSYLRPVALDEPVFVRVTLRRAGGLLIRLTAELWQGADADMPAVTATGTFLSGRG